MLVLDIVLALMILATAVLLLRISSLFQASILFIVFGVLVALAWLRLDAPDAALAEAAIGAGLTGALLLATAAQIKSNDADNTGSNKTKPPASARLLSVSAPTAGLLLLALTAMAAALLWLIPDFFAQPHEPILRDLAYGQLEQSGVSHAVTAVLLSYRAWDTLLELGVLLLALIGARATLTPGRLSLQPVQGPVLDQAVRFLVPVMIVIGVYLLWLGSHAPGGAFQSGAVLAAAMVLYWLAFPQQVQGLSDRVMHSLISMGLVVFVLAGLGVAMLGWTFLQWPQSWAYGLIVFIEMAATVSIAMTLALLFAGNIQTTTAQVSR